jgi:hypothetical protein
MVALTCPATETLDILETELVDNIRVHFIVQMDGGEPCFTFPFSDERLWRKFVSDCFEVGWEEPAGRVVQ